MILVVLLVLVAALVAFVLARRARRSTLAGLNSEKPVFQVMPPPGRLGSMKDGRL